nr:LLM class flavin-dependent oxidoreductase [Cellulosimicrobium sp. MM]
MLPVGVGVLDDGGFSAVPGQPQSLRERAELLDDALAYLDRAWTGERFTFEGTHVRTGEMQFLPRPVERAVVGHHVPVWPVGVWDAERPPVRSLDRTLRADGIVLQLRGDRGFDVPTPDDVSALVGWLTTRRAELGLDAGPAVRRRRPGRAPGGPLRGGRPARRPRRRRSDLVGRVPLEPRDRDPGVAARRDPRRPAPSLSRDGARRRTHGLGRATCRRHDHGRALGW